MPLRVDAQIYDRQAGFTSRGPVCGLVSASGGRDLIVCGTVGVEGTLVAAAHVEVSLSLK